MALSERGLVKGPPWCFCPQGVNIYGSQACAASRQETLHLTLHFFLHLHLVCH